MDADNYSLEGHVLFAIRRSECDGCNFVQHMYATPDGRFVRLQDAGGCPDGDDEAVCFYTRQELFDWLSDAPPDQISRIVCGPAGMEVHIPAKANNGRSSLSVNHTTSFLPVAGLASGEYSEKLFAGTRHRFSGFSQPRQCGEAVLRILVTGGPPNFGGGGMPQRIMVSSRSGPALRTTGAG